MKLVDRNHVNMPAAGRDGVEKGVTKVEFGVSEAAAQIWWPVPFCLCVKFSTLGSSNSFPILRRVEVILDKTTGSLNRQKLQVLTILRGFCFVLGKNCAYSISHPLFIYIKLSPRGHVCTAGEAGTCVCVRV